MSDETDLTMSYEEMISIPEPSRKRWDELCQRIVDWIDAGEPTAHPLTARERVELVYGQNKYDPTPARLAARTWPNPGRFERMLDMLEADPDLWIRVSW